jgi:hypothetical protein
MRKRVWGGYGFVLLEVEGIVSHDETEPTIRPRLLPTGQSVQKVAFGYMSWVTLNHDVQSWFLLLAPSRQDHERIRLQVSEPLVRGDSRKVSDGLIAEQLRDAHLDQLLDEFLGKRLVYREAKCSL